MLTLRLLVFAAFASVFCLVASAQDFHFRVEALKGFSRQLWVVVDKPDDVTSVQYNRLITQVELRLRQAGFRVKSGTSDKFSAYSEERSIRLKDPKVDRAAYFAEEYERLELLIDAELLSSDLYCYLVRLEINRPCFIAVPVVVDGEYFLSQKHKDRDGVEALSRLKMIMARVYGLTAFGTGTPWSGVEDVALRNVDTFINEWLASNEK